MTGPLTLQECAQIAASYEIWRITIECKASAEELTDKGKHAQIDLETIENCHEKAMTTL